MQPVKETVTTHPERPLLRKAEETTHSAMIYTALAALVTGIASAVLLIVDNIRLQKEGKRLAKVYLILEVSLIVTVVAFVAVKVLALAS